MSGEYGKLYKRAWGDADFKALTAHEQLQYLKLISQPDVSMAGILTHAAMRWAGQTADLDAEDIERALEGLECKRFIACDHDTQEVLIRSYIRNDEGWRSPLTMKGIRAAVERILSTKLRRIISAELAKIDTSGLSEKVSERYNGTVRECVEGSLKGLQKGFPPLDVWASEGVSEGVCEGVSEGHHEFAPLTTAPAPAPAPSPATATSPSERGALASGNLPALVDEPASVADAPPPSKRGKRLPDGWNPARSDANLAAEEGRSPAWLSNELASFRDHWAAQPGQKGVKLDWDATWRNWLRKADKFAPANQNLTPRGRPTDAAWDAAMARAAARDADAERAS